MNSLKFRGRMAAVIVAILLITTIFLAVPASASESCDHVNTSDYDYFDNSDGATHNIAFYCYDCSQEIVINDVPHTDSYKYVDNEDGETHTILLHCSDCLADVIVDSSADHTSDYSCDDCGWFSPACSHKNTTVPVHTPDNLDGYSHSTYYECKDCGEVFNLEGRGCYTSSDHIFSDNEDGSSHREYYNCDACKQLVVIASKQIHNFANLPTYTPNNDGATHTIRTECVDCGYVYIKDDDPCSGGSESGVCEECGQGVSCTHDVLVFRYSDNGDGTHKWESVCSYCGYDEIVLMKKPCEYVNGICKYCEAKDKSTPTIPDGAIPAYVFKDSNGRWTVAADEYFGGVNYLDLFKGADPYIHSKSTVSVVRMTSNEIILKDHDGGVMANNNRVVGINFGDLNLQHGVTYYFDCKIESPYLYPRVFLTLRYPDGKVTYLKTGNEFVYVDGLKLQLDLKTNESFSKSHGSPYEVRFYDLMISDKGHTTFEPFGVRYFNNDIAYDDFVAARSDINKLLADYSAGFDYFESIVNGSNVSVYKDNLLKLLSKVEPFITSYRSLYSNYYVEHSNSSTEFSKTLNQLVKGGSFEYNKGYTDGYGSAVKDFDNVSDGGFVEGIINGSWNSFVHSWHILTNGISISGISVSSLVSSIVVIVIIFLAFVVFKTFV